uniref:Helicase n=1 Tax=viral metagenome TaxID=1070528 RepID=A0A6C0DEB2_9ZZZZ
MSFLIQPDLSTAPSTSFEHPYKFPLDPFQQHAFHAISKDENVLVCAKTGSGKTLVGEYQIYHSLKKGMRVFYTTPIKSLSNQKFYDLKHQFTEASVGIMTGDIKFCPDAQIVIMTTEILRNLLYKKGSTTEHLGLTASLSMDGVDAIVFDECHYINDKDRGKVWEETMILLPPSVSMIMLSATLDHPEYLAQWLGELKQKPIHLIQTHYRMVPLTHYVLGKEDKMILLMDPKENYKREAYRDWHRGYHTLQKEVQTFQQKVVDSRQSGIKGAVGGKVHSSHFVHRLNEVAEMLQKKELLPALFFVLSRKQCESYASKMEHSLLDTSDTAAVKHIISFHLYRHMRELEKIPQYHQIYELLCRGVAFHHSGLLPMLKEIIEILFSKGYVKMLFCTETFAVGLNMPTKTVLFAGFKKYDDATASMRILRNDEYIQMAGRAGRRGKDDKGVVIYLPDREPIEPEEMEKMMKGMRPPIQSRMDFHYDFLLKTLQASAPNQPLKWLQLMEQSYWFQQRQQEKREIQAELDACLAKQSTLNLVEPYLSGCQKRLVLEQRIKATVNAERKQVQKELDSLKNSQMGPRWNKAQEDYQTMQTLKKEQEEKEAWLKELNDHNQNIQPVVDFLHQMGYLQHADALTLTNNDLGLKGILATEINEGHPILMTELYMDCTLHDLSGDELVCVLAAFQERKDTEEQPSLSDLRVSAKVRQALQTMEQMANYFKGLEQKVGYPIEGYWNTSTLMVEPMLRWMEGEHSSVLCAEYGLFEGNFIRAVMKIANMLDEWLSLATYCQHTVQVEKIMEVRSRIVRDVVVSDSLYLRL